MNEKYSDCTGGSGPAPPCGQHAAEGDAPSSDEEVEVRPDDHLAHGEADSPMLIPCGDMPGLLVSYRFGELADDTALRDVVAGHLARCPLCHVSYMALNSGLRAFGRLAAEVGESECD